MKELFNGEYKAYIRKRKINNTEIEYIELLFLYYEIPLELVEEVDKKRGAYITNAEDREVHVTLLNESFYARIIRPYGSWFNGQQSFGVEIAELLSEFFDINIFKTDFYFHKNENYRIAFETFSRNTYIYDVSKFKKSEKETIISDIKKECPTWPTEQEKARFDIFPVEYLYCEQCPFMKERFIKDGKIQTICLLPKINWQENSYPQNEVEK
jgi:hypothetical protein